MTESLFDRKALPAITYFWINRLIETRNTAFKSRPGPSRRFRKLFQDVDVPGREINIGEGKKVLILIILVRTFDEIFKVSLVADRKLVRIYRQFKNDPGRHVKNHVFTGILVFKKDVVVILDFCVDFRVNFNGTCLQPGGSGPHKPLFSEFLNTVEDLKIGKACRLRVAKRQHQHQQEGN